MFFKWWSRRGQKSFQKLHLTLSKDTQPCETLTLEFNLLDFPFVQQWAALLQQRLKEGQPLNPHRHTVGFQGNSSSQFHYVQRIGRALNHFRKSGILTLENEADLLTDMDQDKLNILHHYFDQLRGPLDHPSDIYLKSDEDTREQMDIYNESIHALENILVHQAIGRAPIPYVYVEFFKTEKSKLPDSAYAHFTLHRDFGDLFIHYSQVGKSWLEAYEDEDDIMERDNIRPHEFYDGSFDVCFRGQKRADTGRLQTELEAYIKSMGGEAYYPRNALGRLVVAKYSGILRREKREESRELEEITSFTQIHKIELI